MKQFTLLPYTIAIVGLFSTPYLGATLSNTPTFDFGIFEAKSESQEPEKKQEYSSYILRVQFPVSLKKTPPVCAYYKGYNLEFNTDFCIIQETRSCDRFTIAITEQVHREFDSTQVQYLERLRNKKCRLFYLTRSSDQTAPWTIEEEEEKNIPLKLPRNAVVLFLDPSHVEGLQCDKENFKATGIITDPVVSLPYVTIKASISAQELEKTSVSTLLASLDSRGIHPHVPKEVKIDSTAIVSMRTFVR